MRFCHVGATAALVCALAGAAPASAQDPDQVGFSGTCNLFAFVTGSTGNANLDGAGECLGRVFRGGVEIAPSDWREVTVSAEANGHFPCPPVPDFAGNYAGVWDGEVTISFTSLDADLKVLMAAQPSPNRGLANEGLRVIGGSSADQPLGTYGAGFWDAWSDCRGFDFHFASGVNGNTSVNNPATGRTLLSR